MITDARLNKMTSGIIDAIEAARAQQGLSVREVAEKSGVSMNYIYMILRNEHKPSIDILVKVLSALNLSLSVTSDDAN